MLIKHEYNAEMAAFIIKYVQRAIIHNVCMPVMFLVFCPSYYCALHLYEVHKNISNGSYDIERTRVYGQ